MIFESLDGSFCLFYTMAVPVEIYFSFYNVFLKSSEYSLSIIYYCGYIPAALNLLLIVFQADVSVATCLLFTGSGKIMFAS